MHVFYSGLQTHFKKVRKVYFIFQNRELTSMNGIIHSFGINYPFICENAVTDFSCGGLITLLPLALTPFKTKGSTLKYARNDSLKWVALDQERTSSSVIVSKFEYAQCTGGRPVKLKISFLMISRMISCQNVSQCPKMQTPVKKAVYCLLYFSVSQSWYSFK